MKIKLKTTTILFLTLSLIISGCAPASATTAPEVAAAASETSVPTEANTATATLTPTATATPMPVYPLIEPETLGQLRALWSADFSVDYDPDCTECNYTHIVSYAFSWDGSLLAAGVCLGTQIFTGSSGEGGGSAPKEDLWACTAESIIILYDSATGEERRRLTSAALLLNLAFHPNGTLLAAGLGNSAIELWDIESGELTNTLTGAPEYIGVHSLAFTPDGNMLVAGAVSGQANVFQLQLMDWRSGEPLATIDRVRDLAISADGGSLVTYSFASNPYAIRVYELPEADHFTEIPKTGQVSPSRFYVNPRNGWIASVDGLGGWGTQVNFWDPATEEIAISMEYDQDQELSGVDYDFSAGGFTLDGYFLLTRSGELTAPEAQPEATGLSEPLWACGFALADLEANQLFFTPAMLYEDCYAPDYLLPAFFSPEELHILSPDGRFIAADDGYGLLRVWGIDASQPAVPPECSGDC